MAAIADALIPFTGTQYAYLESYSAHDALR